MDCRNIPVQNSPGVDQRLCTGRTLLFLDRDKELSEWSAVSRGRNFPWERTGTHFTVGWVGPSTGQGWR